MDIMTAAQIARQKFVTRRHVCGEVYYMRRSDTTPEGDKPDACFFAYGTSSYLLPADDCPCGYPMTSAWMNQPYRTKPMPWHIATRTAQTRCCSYCWGRDFTLLEVENYYPDGSDDAPNATSGWLVICSACREDTIGFVSDFFVRTRKEEDYLEYQDALPLAVQLGLREKPAKKTETELLADLGY